MLERLSDYAGRLDRRRPNETLIRLAFQSPANLAIIPMQDILGLGRAARMNYPGRAEGNWRWRMHSDDLTVESSQHLHELTRFFDRLP